MLAVTMLVGCDDLRGDVYTLYRDSPAPIQTRVHVATFDASQSEDYNRENCETARRLFASQWGIIVRYWCEKGRYRG